jgi:hypothetical protein
LPSMARQFTIDEIFFHAKALTMSSASRKSN